MTRYSKPTPERIYVAKERHCLGAASRSRANGRVSACVGAARAATGGERVWHRRPTMRYIVADKRRRMKAPPSKRSSSDPTGMAPPEALVGPIRHYAEQESARPILPVIQFWTHITMRRILSDLANREYPCNADIRARLSRPLIEVHACRTQR